MRTLDLVGPKGYEHGWRYVGYDPKKATRKLTGTYKFKYRRTEYANHITAHAANGHTVAELRWNHVPEDDPRSMGYAEGEILSLSVHPRHRRKGLATALIDVARQHPGIEPPPKHSTDLSPDAVKWSKVTPLANGHRRTVELVGPHGYTHGWVFHGIPGVTPHEDLLRMRSEARSAHPAGHPERLKAERAVRQSRKLKGAGVSEPDWKAKVEKLPVSDTAVTSAMQNAHDLGFREDAPDGGTAFWKEVHSQASQRIGEQHQLSTEDALGALIRGEHAPSAFSDEQLQQMYRMAAKRDLNKPIKALAPELEKRGLLSERDRQFWGFAKWTPPPGETPGGYREVHGEASQYEAPPKKEEYHYHEASPLNREAIRSQGLLAGKAISVKSGTHVSSEPPTNAANDVWRVRTTGLKRTADKSDAADEYVGAKIMHGDIAPNRLELVQRGTGGSSSLQKGGYGQIDKELGALAAKAPSSGGGSEYTGSGTQPVNSFRRLGGGYIRAINADGSAENFSGPNAESAAKAFLKASGKPKRRSRPSLSGRLSGMAIELAWDESKHPRIPGHHHGGGEFTKGLGAAAETLVKPPSGRSRRGTPTKAAEAFEKGKSPSSLVNEDTGHVMLGTESGDTFEALLLMKGKKLFEQRYGQPYVQISGALKEGGAPGQRTTPLDFRLDHKYGGELKTLSILAKNQRIAMKTEEQLRKKAEAKKHGWSPLIVVQVIDQATGTVHVYVHEAFESKRVHTMQHLGSYTYTAADFQKAQEHSGHWAKRHRRAAAK